MKLSKIHSEFTIASIGLLIIIITCLSFILMGTLSIQPTVSIFLIFCSLLNLANGMIYPAATYSALEYGACKATSSAIMNFIKLGMPIIALYVSAYLSKSELTAFSLIILLSATLYLVILQSIKIRWLPLSYNKISQ